MERALYKRYGIGAVLVILAAVCIFFGIKNAGRTDASEQYYTTVNAVITEKYVSYTSELDSFADVKYTDLSGVERSGKIVYNGAATIGDTIEIQMSTRNPAVIGFADSDGEDMQTKEIAKNKLYAAAEIGGGVLLFAVGIVLIIRKIKSEKVPAAAVHRAEIQKPAAVAVPVYAPASAPAPVPQIEDDEPSYDIDKILRKIDEKIPPLPAMELVPKRAENLGVFESKLGGVPYMPADFEYPKGKSGIFKGRPLRLLAQLNFEKLPHIENFPRKGILQFFCSDDEDDCAYGINFDNRTEQNGFRIIYHENIIADESRLMPKESMPKFRNNMGNFPFEGEFLLEAEAAEMCPVSSGDYRFNEAAFEVLGKISGKNIATFNDAEEAGFGDDFWEKLYVMRDTERTCIGGYPFFTQDDPREYTPEIADYGVLLFQCASFFGDDTGDEIMWGDMGVGNFFISENDLKNLDFSKVAYNWDCG